MVDQNQTVAAARANAVGALNTINTAVAAERAFRDELTQEEIMRHRHFNDDVLNLAEDLARHIEFRQMQLDARDRNQAMSDEFVASGAMGMGDPRAGAGLIAIENARLAEQAVYDIEEAERLILAEIDHVEAEFVRVAAVLNDERFQEGYAEAVRVDARWEGELAHAQEMLRLGRASMEQQLMVQRYINPYGPVSEFDLPEDIRNARSQMRRFNNYYVDYQLLKAGASIRVSRIPWGRLVMGGIILIIAEVVTAGAINAVIAGAAAGGRLVAASRIGARVGAQIVRRYNNLPQGVRTRLDDLFTTRTPTRRADPDSDGMTNTGQGTSPRNPTCAVGGVVACGI